MDEKMSGMGLVIFLLILFAIFGFRGGFGNNFGGYGNYGGMPGVYGCNATTNCQVEKQGIIDSARTQYLIQQTGEQGILATMADGDKTRAKIDFYAYQDLRDQLTEARNKNLALENRIYSDNRFNALEAQLAELSYNSVKRPPFYSAGGNPCATIYPTGCGGTGKTLV